jgi:hypothetical protein
MTDDKISKAGKTTPPHKVLVVKSILLAAISMLAVLQLYLPSVVSAQAVTPAPALGLPSPDNDVLPTAVAVSVHGKCELSADGITFAELEKGPILEQGAFIRTSDDSRADLFFRRTGTTVRLQASTEMKIEKMTVTIKDGVPAELTLLDLRTGRIFTFVRSAVAGSILEIRNAAGRSVVEGSGIGRYIITADGTHVSAKGSIIPLKVICEDGVTIIGPGEQFARKEGKMLSAHTSSWVKDMIELDEIQAAGEGLAPDAAMPKP